jgi:opacity protein-like surface antigen
MNKYIAAAVVAAMGAIAAPAFAADLIVDQPAAYDPSPVTSGLYIQLLGGSTLDGTLEYYSAYYTRDMELDVPAGWTGAAVVGFNTGIDGVSIEGDIAYSQRDYADNVEAYRLTTGTLMAVLKYTAKLDDTFSLYVGAGLGGISYKDESTERDYVWMDAWGAGYLLKAGLTAQVAENIALVGEVRYSNSFSSVVDTATNYEYHSLGTTAVLAGLQISF